MQLNDPAAPPPSARPRSYEEFWPYFMQCHQDRWTQRLHAIATVWGMGCFLIAFPLTRNAAWLILAPLVSYPIAWLSHFRVEGNRPAAWTNPYWSFLCDLDMTALMFAGQLDPELERLRQSPRPPFSPLRRIIHHATEVLVLAYAALVLFLKWQGELTLSAPFLS